MTPKRAQHLELTEIALKELTTPCALSDERTAPAALRHAPWRHALLDFVARAVLGHL